jgi:general secretion pathway protein L
LSRAVRLASAVGAPGAPSALTRWFDARLNDAAEGFAAASERLRPRRSLTFVEHADGTFVCALGTAALAGGGVAFSSAETARAVRGAEVEFRLSPERCVFRELELPARAGAFLDGVVRAQIDRLTPWRIDEAAFGCSAPVARGEDRIVVTIAAAKRAALAPLLDAGAGGIQVTVAREGEAAPITLLSRRAAASSRRARWRLVLSAALGVSLLAGVAALAADWTIGASLREETDALTASLADARAAIQRRERAGADPAAQALDALKRATPAAVVVLEALSRAIPDDAYLTDMLLKGDKVEISGLAVDAAALIKHIEQSPHFARATFTAPTTRGAEERESFRIEAHVAALNAVSP